jgi:hypothetical protein
VPTSSLAGIITAVASMITALGGLVLAFTVLIPLLRTARSTHKIVNQQHTDLVNYKRALVRALEAAGITVPIDQSVGADLDPQVKH